MAKSFKLPRRKIRSNLGMGPAETQSEATQATEHSGARHIRDLPADQFDLVIESLRDGVALDALVSFFAEQGWLTVTEKTFKQYLGAFRRTYPELIRGEDDRSLNAIASKRKPKLDEELELEQLLRVQKRRIKIGVDFENTTNIVNPNLHRDIGAAVAITELLAKMRGRGQAVGRPTANQAAPASTEAKAQLRTLDQGEAAQDRLATLFGNLAPLLKARAGHE